MASFEPPATVFSPGDGIASQISRIASRKPDRLALVEGPRRLSWGQMDARIDGVAGAFRDLGLRRGDRVALLSANSIEYALAFFGALRAGASVVPLPTMASVAALELMLRDAEVKVLMASEACAARVDAVASGMRHLLPDGRVGLDFGRGGWAAFDDGFAKAPASDVAVPIGGEDEFDVMYSSGTTGAPKGIVHTHAARKASYAGSRARYFDADAVNIVATPFYSNTTCITWLLTTFAGGCNVILGRFDADAFLAAVEEHRATHAMLVPVQYERLLRSERLPGAELGSLRCIFCTSAPLGAERKREILERLPCRFVEIYGLTEGGVVTALEAREHPDKLASVGRPPAGCELRILGEDGREVGPGEIGEVVGRSANMMRGYLHREEATEAMLWRDERRRAFFRSGDVGCLDEDGFLHLHSRKKDVIISGGLNVYPADIEAVLSSHPAVAEVCVIGVPSVEWGETPLALVVCRPGSGIDPEELRAFCNVRVGKHQRLSAVELRTSLPKSAMGKILRRELRTAYWG